MNKPVLYYCKTINGNFGDDLNLFLWPNLLPNDVDVTNPVLMGGEERQVESLFLGVGTLINERVPTQPKKIVFGSGVGYGKKPIIDENWIINFVRGPLSAEVLGLNEKKSISDSAMLLPHVSVLKTDVPKKYKVSFMPHHNFASSFTAPLLCKVSGVEYIDPTGSVESCIEKIRSSEVLICEALHGAIVADSFRVPWIAVKIRGDVNNFKWHDWCASIGVKYKPVVCPGFDSSIYNYLSLMKRRFLLVRNIFFFKNIIHNNDWQLSTDENFKRIQERLEESLHGVMVN